MSAILQSKKSNKIEGIYGRMGDSGAIDGEVPDVYQLEYILVYDILILDIFTLMWIEGINFEH